MHTFSFVVQVPWKHYVPIDPMLDTLCERLSWLHKHPREAERIAANGRAFIREVFETRLVHACAAAAPPPPPPPWRRRRQRGSSRQDALSDIVLLLPNYALRHPKR
eukprot:COSAG01_NODE_90_length_27307_cov_734.166458_34_plen_106_part_00